MKHPDKTWRKAPLTGTEQHAEDLLSRVDRFRESRGWSEAHFGKMAAGEQSTIPRLRETGRVSLAILNRVEAFLANPPEPPQRGGKK